ncbi:PQQ-dependent sugar dehydrogenase [Emticicia agri]|uniref:Sorbosone dehydrogenase n=1 Tax=Emticicia agri TaxID=2492393 RepID=A0A4Q5LZK7_9BACT|nr:PQQ-dependent sugar dehydrogenase [Emticicia agri]RYU95308.1 sorbosone dehydrogenase [Emticicia agri]
MRTIFRMRYLLVAAVSVSLLSAYNYDETPAPAIKVPAGFTTTIIGSELGGTRHMAVTSKGGIYAKISKPKEAKGMVYLYDSNGDGKIDARKDLLDYKGTGIVIKDNYLYSSSNTGVYRYQLDANGEITNIDSPELIVTGLVAKGRDESKSIALDNADNIYVTVGSYDETCKEKGTNKGISPCALLDSVGGVWRFKTNKLNQTYGDGVRYATGLKNIVGLDWNTKSNKLFVMMHGRGQFHEAFPNYYTPEMSTKLPAETMYELHEGADAGWPYVYYDQFQKKKILCPEYGGDGKKTGGEKALNPSAAFPAHLGPNGLLFYTGTQFPAKYRNGAFIAFHGQSPELKKGYMVGFVPFKNGKPSGPWEIFADNFAGIDLAKPTGPVQHRPCGLAQGPDGSIYVSDDLGGTIYKISYKGAK